MFIYKAHHQPRILKHKHELLRHIVTMLTHVHMLRFPCHISPAIMVQAFAWYHCVPVPLGGKIIQTCWLIARNFHELLWYQVQATMCPLILTNYKGNDKRIQVIE
jgi:hypothetical protein